MLIVSVVLFVLALAVGGVGVGGLIGRLPRNRFAGVRTPATMRDDETFALANRIAGPTMLAAAALLTIGGIAALLLDGVLAVAAVVVALLGALLTAGSGGSVGARAAAAMPAAETAGCGNACGCGGEPAVTETPEEQAAAADCGVGSCGTCSLKDACLPS